MARIFIFGLGTAVGLFVFAGGVDFTCACLIARDNAKRRLGWR